MKNFLLFNQLFGTVGSPNQTGETLTRENRIGLMSYLRRTLMLLFAVLVMSMANIGMAWGTTTSSITLGYGLFDGISSQTTVKSSSTYSGTSVQNTDKTFTISTTLASGVIKSGCIQINSGSNTATVTITAPAGGTMTSIAGTFSSGKMNTVSTTPTNTNESPISSNTYTWTGSANSVTFNLTSGASANTEFKSIVITYSVAANKRIYMKAGEWNNDSPYFYAHSWGSSNSDVLMTLADCETDVYYADIPSGNTSVLFTRQSTNSGIKYKNETGNWNQSADITISTNDKFTFSAWDVDGKSTFTGGTYSAPTYTISFNNGGGSGSMSNISSIACGADQTLPANTFTKSGYTFDGWHADVATTVSGSPVAAGSDIANQATLQNITSNIALTAQWEEIVCPESGSVFSLGGWSTSNTSSWTNANNSTVTITGLGTLSGGTATAVSIESSKKPATNGSGDNMAYSLGYNNVALYCALDCNLEAGDVITIVSNGSHSNTFILTTTNSRSTSVTTSCSSGTNTYTVTGSDILHGQKNVYIWRSSSTLNIKTINITRTASCGATQPGEIGKGTLSGCTMRLTASGSPASNNTWYWQASSTGTSTSESGATKDVTTPGTYYIRSYYSTGTCWSEAQSVTVSASDLTPAAPTGLTAASTTAKGTTFTVADAANTNNYDFYVSTSSTAPVAGTGATYTETSKTLTITDKVAGTTYYAWVRAVCGSYKSDWTALTGNTFTTSTVTVTHTLTNVSKTSGGTTAGGSDYTAVYTADAEYSMPTPTVTIDGNTATSGTDYTWSDGTLTIPANKINGNIVITLNSVPSAPSSAVISGTYHYFPGENISLTVTPTGNNGPTTYQWYKGGKENGNAIEGATSATYTKNSCAFADAGSYYCKVTCNETSIWANTNSYENYDVKILRLYVNGSKSGEPYGNVDFTKVDGTTATASIALGSGWTYGFNIADGCGHYYGNSGTMTENNCTNWTTNVNGTDCGLTTTNAATYIFTINYSSLEAIVTSVTYPVGNQAADKVIYFDNNVLKWTGSSIYYRIGHSSHSQASQLSLVSGTANLYKMTTTEYNGFSGWHIANATGDVGSGKSIYKTVDGTPITEATAHEGGAVTQEAITVTPTTSKGYGADVGVNDNCEFYNYTITNGMKTDNVSITAPSNGTISVAYTDVEGASQSFTSGNRDLAHTVIITPTATPAEGYTLSGLTVNGVAHTSGTTYTVTANTTIAATFTAKTYNITLDRNGASSGSESVTMTYNSSSHTAITAPVKAGYTFDGWYDTETDNNGSGNLVMNASGVLQENVTGFTGAGGIWTKDATCTLYAKWTAAASLTAIEENTLYQPLNMLCTGMSPLPSSDTYFTDDAYSTDNRFYYDVSSGNGPKAHTISEVTLGSGQAYEATFTSEMWVKGTSTVTDGIPSAPSIKFLTPSTSGTLYLYIESSSCPVKFKKEDGTASNITGLTQVVSGKIYSTTVEANSVYYIYGNGGSNTGVYGLKLITCSTPAAPTGFTAGSITSTGATFSITDGGDAASYDIYYSTSSSAPAASAAATTTSTSKTKAVTGLTASTTYYAWVRSVCDASHKSAWVALSGSSFTTSAAAALNDGCWDPANTAADKLTSGDVTLTTFDNNFSGVTGITSVTLSKGAGDGKCSSADETPTSSGYLKVKNASSSGVKIITIVTSATKDITIGGQNYSSNTGSFYLVKSTAESTKLAECNTGATSKATNCPAGTYYVYAKGNNSKSINFSLLCIEDAAPDETAPTFVSSVPANGATDVATSGTIVLTFNEPLGSVDASKFTLTGATKDAVSIDGSDATKVNITYSGAANSATVTLATAAAAVSDVAGNALAAALSNISFTTAAAAPAGDCEELFAGSATSTSVFTTTVGSATTALSSGDSFSSGGYSYSVKPNSTNPIVASPKSGSSFVAGDSLIVVVYNNQSGAKTMGFKLGSGTYTTSVGSKKLHIFRQVLVASDISAGKVTFTRQSSDDRWVEIIIKHCGLLPSCTTPVLPTLTAKTVCEGGDADAAWNATITNSGSLVSGETVAYSWVKKGSSTVLSSVATYQPTSVTEAMAGTYVVTATVSADGKASKSATKEVELTVNEATEVTAITADKATVYPTNSVTLTATANMDATWQWYTCTNAEGDGESPISGAKSASYTIASAPAAGTHYYKVKATGECGIGSMVYTLTVSAAAGGDCETEFWFAYDSDRPEGAAAATHITTALTAGSTASASITIDGNTYAITKRSSNSTGPVTIVIPEGNTGTVYVLINGSNSRSLTLTKGGVSQWSEVPVGWTSYSITGLDEGTYTLSGSGNLGWGLVALKLCSAVACTDPEVTASVNNSTACVGTSVTFTATGAHAEATYQWQKYSGGAWTNIADANASTYTIPSVATTDALKYRVIASHVCDRTSNEVTLSVPSAPDFGSTVPSSVSVMQTIALSINTVEATDAVKYRWYKSADATWDAGDTEIGTNKELIKAYDGEAIGSPSYYIFCRAQNACGITTSTAIAVNVTAYVEEDCATRGNEGDAEFGFQNSGCGQGTYNSASCWTMNSNGKILIYSAPDGKYFKTMKVTIASSSASKASYNWSTDGGSSYTADGVAITGVTTTLTEKTINLSAHGNVNEVKIGRNFGNGESSGTLYVSKICFEYTDACTATTVTPSTSSVNYEMDGAWDNPTFTLSVAGTLTYSSSNEDIASVDDEGTVTFNGEAGVVTITAAYAGNATYCASEGSYTITVSCPGGAPKIVAAGSVNMSGCNSSVTLNAKTQAGADFADGTYQWFRNGEEIDGATSSSYDATQAGTYTVERTNTSDCTTPSTNSAIVTSETTEPEVERLVPFQYYHVDKTYTDQMKMRHLFAVKNSGTLDGKHFKMYVSRNGGAATDVTSSNALVVVPNGDGHVDTVMVDLNKLSGKYSENDELVFTCKAIDCTPNVSEVYKNTITMRVIGATPTLALICSGSSKAGGTRKTSELTVGGDFLTGYNVADLCQQTGNTSFDANTEWGLYTRLKENYIVTPVNGYAVFNKLNYEPFDILLLTDYPKASKSDAAKDVLDDMADLCDYRPMLSFKAHMVAKTPSKWAAKGFTTSPVVPKNTRTRLNIVCYAHPMFADMKETATHIQKDNDDPTQIVYTMLTGAGYESSKGLQGFELEAAENFVTIGLVHYNASPADATPSEGLVTWTPGTEDRMLVTAVERQENPEARMIMFAVNCGAQSKFTETGRDVVLKCLKYLLTDHTITPMADCSFTFDNGAGNTYDAATQASKCPSCTGTKGDGKWSTAANWGPDYVLRPGKDTEVKIAAPVTVDPAVGTGAATNFTPKVRSVRIVEGGKIEIPAGSYLEVVSTIRRQDGNDLIPTEVEDLHIGSSETGNGTLILNNSTEDTKAQVDMYSKGFIDHTDPEKEPNGVKNYQYIGTPFVEVNALYNYYGSWIYSWGVKKNGNWGWVAVKNGGPMTAWTGYCITQEAPTYHQMSGTLTATGTVDIPVEAGQNMVVGNSWTAPIDISKFATTDFENLVGNVYFFNTGVDKTGTAGAAGSRYAGSTYVTVPINSAPYTEDDHIPSLQGFFVKSNGSAGTLHLDYDKHVRGSSRAGRLSEEMHAPARRAAFSSDEPTVLKIKVSGENYDDKLLLLEREDFTEGFDNGWDGDKWDGNESALYIYTTDNNGTENSVSAIPELEGTIIGFRAGEEDDAYTLNFEYLNSDEPLYLYDVENNTYTQIMTGMTYRFFTTDNEKHERFIITRSNGQEVATGVEPVSGSLDRSKAKKLLIEDKMFIMVNGMLYDATGKVVK